MDYLKQDSKWEADQLKSYDVVRSIHKKPNYYFTNIQVKEDKEHYRIYRQKTPNGKKELFLELGASDQDGPFYVGNPMHSPTGKFLAYFTGPNLRETTTRVACAEKVKGLCEDKGHTADVIEGRPAFDITWSHDDRGFFYTQLGRPRGKQASSNASAYHGAPLYYHRLGTQQSQDQLISLPPEAEGWISSVDISSDGNWLMLSLRGDSTTSLWVAPMNQNSKGVPQKPSFRKLANMGEGNYSYIATHGSRLYFIVNESRPRSKVVAYDMNAPNDGLVDVAIARDGHEISSAYAIARNHILVKYIQGSVSTLAIYEMGTNKHVRDIKLPLGSVKNIWTRPDDGEVFFSHDSMLNPQTIYHYDFASNATSTISEAKLPGFDASAFEVRQVSVAGKNGASFPMFIAARKGIQLDGSHPTLISTVSISGTWYTPWFSNLGGAFMKHFRGIYVLTHVDYVPPGDSGADKKNGQHQFVQNIDNIKSASAYLAQHNYTKPALLTVHGANAEATAVAAAVNQAPNQFGCALIEKGIMDLSRLPRDDRDFTLQQPFGNPAKKDDFGLMLKYSPLQNIDDNRTYPAMLFITNTEPFHNVPWHSYKMVAQLQHKLPNNPRPLMLREMGDPDKDSFSGWRARRTAARADMLSFVATSLGLKQNA
ncbi:prolyl oligopeptidase [Syncephalis pseudoplumigaleata]|uniref:Prolyl endopeptidase n=1 Tax=Syncephalis pseudoplumigaleata TaxID=1712513 RepID=A0A4P9YUS6_9FUNG|nr:prolyl oligopeptidase [Syncephalis pseudoplumigaleata]|eukprot:RKP22961.1 prolyl oligopeptidase [Syncephalis pseudoplumigaleata]